MKKIITEVILVPDFVEDPCVFSEGAIKIRYEDEAAGGFLVLSSVDGDRLSIDFNELDELIAACKELKQE